MKSQQQVIDSDGKTTFEYKASGQLIEHVRCAGDDGLHVVLVKTRNQDEAGHYSTPTPYVVCRYRTGCAERCNGTYCRNITEAAAEYVKQVHRYTRTEG